MTTSKVLCCRDGCCPRLVFSDDGKTALLDADVKKDDVILSAEAVGIRLNPEHMQMVSDELARHGVVPSPDALATQNLALVTHEAVQGMFGKGRA